MFNALHRKSAYTSIMMLVVMIVALSAQPASGQSPDTRLFPPAENTEWGEPEAFGDGEIRTFITLDSSGTPELVGIYFTEGMLASLPEAPSDGAWDVVDADGNVVIPCCGHEVVLDFPQAAEATPFDHFVLNWNPMGHMPPGIYDTPHFDLHFYLISNDERTAIAPATADTMCYVPNAPDSEETHPVPVSCETFEEAMLPLPETQMPPGFFAGGAVEPAMGNHLADLGAPEFQGEPFTHTWIYGSYAGRLTFFEPMIATSFLEERLEETCSPIVLPDEMHEAGYYPSAYCMRYLADEAAYVVTLESFVEF